MEAQGGSLRANASWLMGGQLGSLAVQVGYFAVLARLLGVRQYGVLAGITALVALAGQYSSLGSGFVLLRHVSPDRSRFRAYWGHVLLSSLLGGSAVVLLLLLLAPRFLRGVDLATVLFLALGECVFAQLTLGASRVFQAFEQMRFSALLAFSTNALRFLTAAALFFFVHHATARVWASASMCVSLAGTLAAVTVVTRRFGRPALAPGLLRARTGEGLLFALSGSNTSIFNDVDKLMLGHYGMTVANGVYSMGYRVIEMATLPIRSVHSAAYARFCRAGVNGLAPAAALGRGILKKTVLLGGAGSAVLFLGAPLLPPVVGASFAPSVEAIRWLCLLPLFRCFHLSAGDALSGSGYQRWRFAYESVAAAGNVALNLSLIPRYSWRGAAWSSLATDFFLGLASWLTVRLLLASPQPAVPQAVESEPLCL